FNALPGSTGPAAGTRFTYREITTASAKFDLTLAIGEVGSAFVANLVYDAHLFDAGTAERLGAHFLNLLHDMLAAPDTPLRDLEILAPAERRQLASGRLGRAQAGAEAGLEALAFPPS